MDYPADLQLWQHQAEAVNTIAPFLDAQVGPRTAGRPSALVNIPTGGGKTAVIGTLAHWHPRLRRVLVLAPRTAIRDQLAKELAATRGFFQRQGYQPNTLPKRVLPLSSARDVPARLPGQAILVSTIQLLVDMASDPEQRATYERLANSCDAAIVDEGHYEPARAWSRTIRGLERPIILVTATPYRNDLKIFEFSQEFLHISRYVDLMEQRILRRVEIAAADPETARQPPAFVESVLTAFVQKYGEPPTAQRKLIIRCRDRDQIRQIGDQMRAHRFGIGGVLCLHENFTPNAERPWERRQPTDPEDPDAPAVWVHQHKLLEGVDGPSFRAVAFYGVLGSARALVQQIGRVIRNPLQDAQEQALMIDHTRGYLEDTWRRFLAYDAQVSPDTLLRGLAELAAAFDQNFPLVIYADRQFRQRLQLNGIAEQAVRRSLRLPLRCHLYQAAAQRSLIPLADATRERLDRDEFPSQVVTSTEDEVIILFEKVQTSPLLADHYFVERELHAFVARRHGRVVAILDTSRPGLDQLALAQVGPPLSRQQLARLLNCSPHTRIVEMNARNAALGPSAVRRRSTTAASLEDTPPTLDEFQFVASSMTSVDRAGPPPDDDGDADRFSVRSLGFGHARISDAAARDKLDAWIAWTNRLVGVASDGARTAPKYLDRFAHPLDQPPAPPWPRSVLIDLEEARQLFVTNAINGIADGAGMEIEDICLECTEVPGRPTAPRMVSLIANGVRCTGTFEYQPNEQRYWLVSGDLERVYRYEEGPPLWKPRRVPQ